MAVFGGAGGHFVSWGPVLSVRDPTDTKPVLAVTGRQGGVFGNVLAHRNRVHVAQLSYSDDVGGFHPSFFEKIAIYWFLEGSGHLEKFRAPTDKKKNDPKKNDKKVENFIFRCGFKK